MKKLLLLLIPFLMAAGEVGSVAGKADSAISTIMGVSGASISTLCGKDYNDGDVAAVCMTGTYILGWDGDWTGDTDKACAGSGDTTGVDGTIAANTDVGTDYGESGSVGVKSDAANETILWSDSGGTYFDINGAVTVWIRLYISETPTGDTCFFSFEADANNYFKCVVKNNREIYCSRKAAGTETASAYGAAISIDTWTDIGYTMDYANQDHAVWSVSSWEEDTNEITTEATDVTLLYIGSKSNYSMGVGEFIQVDRFAIVSGYKASKPAGW